MNTWHPLRSRKCHMLNVDEINAQLKPGVALLKQEMQHLRAPASLETNLLDAFARQHPIPKLKDYNKLLEFSPEMA